MNRAPVSQLWEEYRKGEAIALKSHPEALTDKDPNVRGGAWPI